MVNTPSVEKLPKVSRVALQTLSTRWSACASSCSSEAAESRLDFGCIEKRHPGIPSGEGMGFIIKYQ